MLTKTADIPFKTESIFDASAATEYFIDAYNPPKGIRIIYHHNGLTQDGDLILHFELTKGDQPVVRTAIEIPVIGIDLEKAKISLEQLTPKVLTKTTDIPPLTDETTFGKTEVAKYFIDENYQEPYGIDITYSHEGLTQDGNLVLNFKLTKVNQPEVKTSINIPVRGIDLEKAKTYLEGLTPKQLTKTADIPALIETTFDASAVAEYFTDDTYNPPTGVTITYSHNGLTQDGNLVLNFKIRKVNQPDEVLLLINIPVIGIDLGNAIAYLQGLTPKVLTKTTDIPALTETTFDKTEAEKYFTDTYEKPDGIDITYSHEGLIGEGNLVLHFKLTKGNQPVASTLINILVTGVDQSNAIAYLAGLTPKQLTKTADILALTDETPFDTTEAAKYFTEGNYQEPSGVTITYSHNGLTHDGNLVLNFKIKKVNQPDALLSVNIPVIGIDLGKAKTYFEKLTTKTQKASFNIDPLEETIFYAGNGLRYFNDYEQPKGVTIKYSHTGLDHDGTLVLHFTIEKQGQTPIVISRNVLVYGIDQENAASHLYVWNRRKFQVGDSLPTPKKGTLDSTNVNQFFDFSRGPAYSNLENVTITYEVSEIENYEFKVEFTIASNTSPELRRLDITYYMGDRDVNQVYDYLEGLTPIVVNTSNVIPEYLESNKQDFNNEGTAKIFDKYSLPNDKVTVKYTHPLIDEDGMWAYTLYIEKDGVTTRTLIKSVGVEGISMLRATNYLRSLTPKTFDQPPTFPEIDDTWKEPFDATAAARFFTNTYIPPKGATITYYWVKWNNQIYLEFTVDVWKYDHKYKFSRLIQILIPIGN